jgi:small subunit ribosomal protein S20
MANHKSSLKRIRQTAARKAHNHYYAKTARNAVRDLRKTTDKKAAAEALPKVSSMLDKLAKRNIIHDNKARLRQCGKMQGICELERCAAAHPFHSRAYASIRPLLNLTSLAAVICAITDLVLRRKHCLRDSQDRYVSGKRIVRSDRAFTQ